MYGVVKYDHSDEQFGVVRGFFGSLLEGYFLQVENEECVWIEYKFRLRRLPNIPCYGLNKTTKYRASNVYPQKAV